MKLAFYSVLILVLGGLLLYGSLIYPKFQLSASVSSAINSVFRGGDSAEQIKQLQLENADLKAQIFDQKIIGDKIKVYSTYPFNSPTEIAIAAGHDRDINVGDIVTAGSKLFVGKVSKVFRDYSIVDTIFDPNMKIEVRVGEKEADALFTGGNAPALSYLSKNAGIASGDIVYTAEKGYKYGLEVGTIKAVIDTLGDPVKRADVEPALQLNDLRDVEVHA